MNLTRTITITLIAISFVLAAYLYPQMPDMMASHWNYKGEVDGYMSKFGGLFFMPTLSLVLFALFLLIPKIDPRKENIAKFGKYFDGFILAMEIFLFYLYILTILWSSGLRFDMTELMAPAMGLLFYYCGVLVENSKPNWFIGIRTPWTLSSEKVWNETNRLGGKLFKMVGVISFLGILGGSYAIFFMLVPVILASIYIIVHSYFLYAKETGRKTDKK